MKWSFEKKRVANTRPEGKRPKNKCKNEKYFLKIVKLFSSINIFKEIKKDKQLIKKTTGIKTNQLAGTKYIKLFCIMTSEIYCLFAL